MLENETKASVDGSRSSIHYSSEKLFIKMNTTNSDLEKKGIWKWWIFLNSQQSFLYVAGFLLFLEFVLNPLVIMRVPCMRIFILQHSI